MAVETMIGALLGSLVTWAISKFIYDKRRRHYLRDTTEKMKQSGEIQERHYSVTAMVYRSALEEIEAGDIEAAKRTLSHSIATFYQTKTEGRRELESVGILPDAPDWTGQELRAIEHHAKKSESLRTALARKPDDDAA
ncbi:MAG: hypothetical protein HZA89_01665 [Verrucomicrobia bacterium]|nr:hypothetical protein [Verrucomicrobiota bacterium]